MNKITSNKIFIAGFIGGLCAIILLNIFYLSEKDCGFDFDYMCDAMGFPFVFFKSAYVEMDGYGYIEKFSWLGLTGTVSFALLIGLLVGLLSELVWSKIAPRKLK